MKRERCLKCGKICASYRYGLCCSWKCLNAYYLRRKDTERIVCAGCGKAIIKWGGRKFCSDECRRLSRRLQIPEATRRLVFRRSGGRCVYCGDSAEAIDHVRPYSRQGKHDESNFVASCATCNSIASDKLFGSVEEKRQYILKRRGFSEKDGTEQARPAWHKRVYGGQRNPRK